MYTRTHTRNNGLTHTHTHTRNNGLTHTHTHTGEQHTVLQSVPRLRWRFWCCCCSGGIVLRTYNDITFLCVCLCVCVCVSATVLCRKIWIWDQTLHQQMLASKRLSVGSGKHDQDILFWRKCLQCRTVFIGHLPLIIFSVNSKLMKEAADQSICHEKCVDVRLVDGRVSIWLPHQWTRCASCLSRAQQVMDPFSLQLARTQMISLCSRKRVKLLSQQKLKLTEETVVVTPVG